jgi:CheY-like chemotaxis protein
MPDTAPTVLVVDDDALVVKSIVLCLQKTNWKVQTALSAKTAFDMARRSPPTVLLCDASMPDMTGIELIKAIKGNDSTARTRSILMTGLPLPKSFPDVPWDALLEKPFGAEELRAMLKRLA